MPPNNQDALKANQFTPGKSGNPNGRPKGSGVADRLRRLLEEEVTLKGKKLTMADALAQVVLNKAMKGDHKFVKEILDRLDGKVTDRLEVDGDIRMIQQRFEIAKKPDDDN